MLTFTTLDAQTLLTGERLSAQGGGIPKTERVRISETCRQLETIGATAKLYVSFHVLGRSFQASSFSAELVVSDAVSVELAADRQADQVDATTVTSATSGSGLSVDIGPFSYSKGGGETTTKSETKRYRVIDSDWVQNVVDRAMTSIDVQRICDSGASCVGAEVPDLLSTFLNTYVSQATASVAERADGSYRLAISGIPTELQVNIDESLKQQLDLLWENSSQEEATIPVGGVPVTAKRIDNNTMKLNGGVEWSRNGEQWIPTSFQVSVVSETDLVNQLNLRYSSAILGGAQRVSVAGGQADPFSRDAASVLVGPTLSERVAALEARQLSCRIFEAVVPRSNAPGFRSHVSAEVVIDDGYVLAGGGCRAWDFSHTWTLVTDSRPLGDGRQGWSCRYNPVPNWANNYSVEASAIGCIIKENKD